MYRFDPKFSRAISCPSLLIPLIYLPSHPSQSLIVGMVTFALASVECHATLSCLYMIINCDESVAHQSANTAWSLSIRDLTSSAALSHLFEYLSAALRYKGANHSSADSTEPAHLEWRSCTKSCESPAKSNVWCRSESATDLHRNVPDSVGTPKPGDAPKENAPS